MKTWQELRDTKILGKNLALGDVLFTWSGPRTITHFESHPGLTREGVHYSARIACSGDWCITVFDDELCEAFAREGGAS